MKKMFLLFLMVLMAVYAMASVSYRISPRGLEVLEKAEFSTVKLDGAQSWGEPGDPMLPWIGVKLIIPNGTEADQIVVRRMQPRVITLSKPVQPIQQQYPLSSKVLMPVTAPNPNIYEMDKAFPLVPHNGIRTDFLAGHSLAFSAICPFDYNPVKGELTIYEDIQVEVLSSPSSRASSALSLLKEEAFVTRYLMKSVDNTESVPRYQERTSGIEYIIIIDQSKYNQWLPLANLYRDKGYSVILKPIQEIYTQNTGVDNQQKIRNYLTNMYATNSLRYVLLAGDTDVIPHRGLYVNFSQGGQTDADIPADMYYSCLDGSWNNDNDAYWGEMYEADLAPEFAIGRFCYNNDTEIGNMINKVMMYQIAPVVSSIKSSAFVGEWLWDGPTWGGDYMDEMIGGSSMHGYTTVGVPTTWNTPTLYDRTYGYENGWGGPQIRALLSAGHNLVNHLGHSATTYNMRLSNNGVTANTITNNGSAQNYSIYFTQGCYAGAFDNRDTNVGQYVGDCITEKFTSIATSAVGMISHSRYGWGMQGSTNGASQYLHRQYIDAIFGEQINELGYTLVDSKIDNIPYISNSPVMYWVTYETNLIGDPAMMIWSDTPQTITANLPSVWTVGVNNYQIQTNAPNAEIRILSGTEIVYEGSANANGLIDIHLLQSFTPGDYMMYINARNFFGYQTQFSVEVSQMPYIVCTSIQAVDTDGLIQAGESISLSFNLQNVGTINQTQGGTLTLSSSSQHISIAQNTYSFNAVNAGATLEVASAFVININSNFIDQATVPLVITASFGSYTTTSNTMLTLSAPALSIGSYQIHNSSNIILPGHTPQISFNVQNTGSGYAYSPLLILMPDDPNITINTYELELSQIAPGATLNVPLAFSVSIGAGAQIGSDVNIGYYITGENGSGSEGSFSFHIGHIVYSFENDLQNWTTEAPNAQFTNQWHRNNGRNYTNNGSFSVKFGGTGTGQYANSAYGALISPEITLSTNAMLKFYHWMSAETHATSTGMAWDGGLVQIQVAGGAWQQISPNGGYPYRIYSNPASPFTANTWVYSGNHSWQEAIFDLSAYTGVVKFRFLFGSDSNTTGEGWYIDDIRVEGDIVDADNQVYIPQSLSLSNYPNPFNPTTTISFSIPSKQIGSLDIYNLKGQRVKSLLGKSELQAGTHHITWDGKDETGKSLASGVYFYRLTTPSGTLTQKMLMVK